MWKDKLLTLFTIILFATGAITISWVLYNSYFMKEQIDKKGVMSCVTEQFTDHMKDDHLAGLLDKGSPFEVFKNYYKCNEVKRGDLVYFRISPPIEPVVKVVHGIPGDKFEVVESENKSEWHIKINGQLIMAGEKPYFIRSQYTPPLKTYEISRGGRLAPDEYIILSTVPPGLSDSSNLGLIKSKALEGRVFIP